MGGGDKAALDEHCRHISQMKHSQLTTRLDAAVQCVARLNQLALNETGQPFAVRRFRMVKRLDPSRRHSGGIVVNRYKDIHSRLVGDGGAKRQIISRNVILAGINHVMPPPGKQLAQLQADAQIQVRLCQSDYYQTLHQRIE